MKETQLVPAHLQPVAVSDGEESTRLMDLIIRGASDQSVDVSKMERLVQLHERITARQAEKAFNDALRVVQSKMPAIVKTARNPSTNSSYAKLEHVQEIANPILFEHGFSLSFGTDQSPLAGHYGVTGLLAHAGGHSRLYRCDVPTDTHGPKGQQNKTATHGFGSAVSYGERYLIKLILNIRLIGEDDDGNRGARAKPPGPSSLAGDNPTPTPPTEKALKQKLVDLTRAVHGATGYNLNEVAKQALTEWLIAEAILSDTESITDLHGARLAEVVKAVEAKK